VEGAQKFWDEDRIRDRSQGLLIIGGKARGSGMCSWKREEPGNRLVGAIRGPKTAGCSEDCNYTGSAGAGMRSSGVKGLDEDC